MANTFPNNRCTTKSNSKTCLLKTCSNWIKAHVLTILYVTSFISIVTYILSHFENNIVTIVAFCTNIALLFFTGTIAFTHTTSKSLIDFFVTCWEWINTHIITIFIAIALVFVFLYFENEIIETSFSFINKIKESTLGHVLLWILWSSLLLVLLYNTIQTIKDNTLSDGRAYFLSIIACVIFAYCFLKYPWGKDRPIKGQEWAFIVLFILFILHSLVIPFILFFTVKSKANNYKLRIESTQNKDYLNDEAINSKKEDKLNFDEHVKTLKGLIDKIPYFGTYSIAITGGWGKGKTSFLNLLQQELIDDEEQYEIMLFNPLKSSKSDNIQNDFFNLLEKTLSKYKRGFGRRIKYYKELIGAINNKYVSFLIKLGSIHLKEEKERINDIIKMIPKRVIIIIDDVDRLKEHEIIQVFRLIKFNAKFDNVVFLLALDKQNIIETLKCNDKFPDKFFEMEFPLPHNGKDPITVYIANTLKDSLPEISTDFINKNGIPTYTAHCIDTFRDAKRFLNNFIDRVKMINKKLDICSYYILSLIQYKYPATYEKLKNQDLTSILYDSEQTEPTVILHVDEELMQKKPVLYSMLDNLFPNENRRKKKIPTLLQESQSTDLIHYINQPNFFSDYFNDSTNRRVSEIMIRELLSLSNEEFQQSLEKYTSDEISKQNIIEYCENHNVNDLPYATNIENHPERQALNYCKICNLLNLNNGLVYSDGIALICLGQKLYALINESLDIVLKVEYDKANPYSEGFSRVYKDWKYGFINTKGEIVIPCEFEHAGDFSEGFASVYKNRKYGFINTKGEIVIPCEYDYVKNFSQGRARVNKGDKWGYIDKTGNIISD